MAGSIRKVPAVIRALDVLDTFLDGTGPRTVAEITAQLGIPRSTAYELVQTLVARRCLRLVDEHAHRYDLGLHLFELGSAYADGVELSEQGRQVAQELVARSGETVHVATLDGTEVVYLVKVDTPRAVRMVSAVGQRLPAHCTAVGKVWLSGLQDGDLAGRYGDGQWVRMTPNSLPSLDALVAELARIRERGLAFDNCESNVDLRCVAAPVRDASGHVVAGLSVSVPAHRADRLADELADYVAHGARALSARLGHRERVGA